MRVRTEPTEGRERGRTSDLTSATWLVALLALLFACGPRPDARHVRTLTEPFPQRTPDEALRSFLRAVDGEQWNIMLRFTPARYRATMTAEMLVARWHGKARDELLASVARVRAHLDEPMQITKDEARLPLDERRQAKLVRESDGWKVDALE
jgi:hypothetical protein